MIFKRKPAQPITDRYRFEPDPDYGSGVWRVVDTYDGNREIDTPIGVGYSKKACRQEAAKLNAEWENSIRPDNLFRRLNALGAENAARVSHAEDLRLRIEELERNISKPFSWNYEILESNGRWIWKTWKNTGSATSYSNATLYTSDGAGGVLTTFPMINYYGPNGETSAPAHARSDHGDTRSEAEAQVRKEIWRQYKAHILPKFSTPTLQGTVQL